MSNFDYLKKDSDYDVFTEACIEAENLMDVSYSAVATYSRRALELAVKWMFVNDRELHTPLQYTLVTLITDRNFTNIIPSDMPKKLSYIQKLGNKSVHSDKKISRKEAILSLRNLFNFTNWIDYAYSKNYTDIEFDENILVRFDKNKLTQVVISNKNTSILYNDLKLFSKDILGELIKNEEYIERTMGYVFVDLGLAITHDMKTIYFFDQSLLPFWKNKNRPITSW